MSTLFLRLPCRAIHDVPPTDGMGCRYAWLNAGKVERQGHDEAKALAALIAAADRVVLLLAGADVTVLKLPVPPMPPSKLKALLPHLIEEHTLSSPEECHIVVGERIIGSDTGLHRIALVDLEWLEDLVDTVKALGARQLQALPLQCVLPGDENVSRFLLSGHGDRLDVAGHMADDRLGAWLMPAASPEATVAQLKALAPDPGGLRLYVAGEQLADYSSLESDQISILPDDESFWNDLARRAERHDLNLLAGLQTEGQAAGATWKTWRWPLALGVLLLLLNSLALNFDWWRMSREARALQHGMVSAYRTAFPNESVVVDPLLQTQQKIVQAAQAAGSPAASDFLALITRFSGAWQGQDTLGKEDLASVEYRDGMLLVRLKDAAVANENRNFMEEQLKRHKLALTAADDGSWKVGNK